MNEPVVPFRVPESGEDPEVDATVERAWGALLAAGNSEGVSKEQLERTVRSAMYAVQRVDRRHSLTDAIKEGSR